MREITLQELAALAENAKGEIRRIYLHWTAGHYNNTYDDYHLNITGDGTVWSSCGKLTEYKEHTWHRNSGAVAVSICCCADAVAYADGGVDFGSVPPTRQQLETLARVVAVLCRHDMLPQHGNLGHACFRRFDPCGKLVEVSGRCRRFLRENGVI